MEYAVILVHATSHALRAEKLFLGAGIACRLIPVPRHLSSDCGVCLRVNGADKERAAKLLEEASVEVDKVYDIAG